MEEKSPQNWSALFKDIEEEIAKKTRERIDPGKRWDGSVVLSEVSAAQPIFKMSPALQAEVAAYALSEVKRVGAPDTNPFHDVAKRIVSVTYPAVMNELVSKLCKRGVPFSEKQLVQLIDVLLEGNPQQSELPINSILSNIESFADRETIGSALTDRLERLRKKVGKGNVYYLTSPNSEGQKIIHRLELILLRGKTGTTPIPISPEEAWSDQAIADLNAIETTAREAWIRLLDHCSKASGTTPSGTWLKKANELVHQVGEECFIVHIHRWFTLLPQKGSRTGQDPSWGANLAEMILPQNADKLKGLAFACSGKNDARLASALGDAAEASFKKVTGLGPRCPKLGTACVHALATMNTKDSVAQLTRVQGKAKHASVKFQIEKALNNAATKSGMSVDDLQDIGVPDFAMVEVGRLVRKIGNWSAQMTIENSSTIEMSWVSDSGKKQQSVPSEIKTEHADQVKELKKIEKDLKKLIPGLQRRIERSYLEQRNWRYDQWKERYLNHPVTGVIARKLVWNFNGRSGIWLDGNIVDQDHNSITPPDDAVVALWHPIGCDLQVVLRWRSWLMEHQKVQPFKQCHREIYILTDAERQTETYSNRFAAHVLRQHQMQHLCLQRGWQYHLMGSFDSHNVPTLQLPCWNMVAEFHVDANPNTAEAGIYTIIGSDKVQFLRKFEDKTAYGGYRYEPIVLTEISPVVFSEVMRDVDLFVGVCSIGTDPNWTEGFHDYWRAYSFGDLSQGSVARKQILEELIPHLRIASRCKFEGKFLEVQGDIRKYKIHIGSGNILMEPNDQYLCIVPAKGLMSSSEKIFLPFEGDTMLSLILSKAFLLADDKKIKDPSIVSQINARTLLEN